VKKGSVYHEAQGIRLNIPWIPSIGYKFHRTVLHHRLCCGVDLIGRAGIDLIGSEPVQNQLVSLPINKEESKHNSVAAIIPRVFKYYSGTIVKEYRKTAPPPGEKIEGNYTVTDKRARVHTVLLPWNDREIHAKTGATERLLLKVSIFLGEFC
jgi:hypothetical protein